MSASNLVDPLTNKIYDQYIPQGGGVSLTKGQLITANGANVEVPFPTVAPADGSVLSWDSTEAFGLKYIAIPGVTPLDYQELLSANPGNQSTVVPAPTSNNYVLTSDNTLGVASAGMAWKALGGSGVITAKLPLVDSEPVAGTNQLAINFSATVGEIPYGNGTALTGALTNAPTAGQILGVAGGVPTWIPAGGSGTVTATPPLVESAGVGNASNIAINFATKGEIPVGTGAGTGALLPLTATDGYVLTAKNSLTNGMEWASVGSTLATSNFFPITLPLGAVPPNYPISQAGGSNELVLGTPVTLSVTNPAFTQNQIITIQNQTAIDPNPSANTFLMPQIVPSTVKPGYASASYCGEGVKAFDGYWWSCESEGAVSALCYSPLPLTTNSTSTLIAQVATGTQFGGQQIDFCWATEDYIYFSGGFGQVTVVATSTVIPVKNVFKVNKTTGAITPCGAGTVGCIGLDGNVSAGIACPTTDKAQGTYLSNPRSCVMGGSFSNTFGGVTLACRRMVFYTEATDTFSVVGAVAGDGVLDTTVGIYASFVSILFYNDDTNCLYITGQFIGGTIINGVNNSTPNYITGFAWNVIAGPAFSVSVPVGTVGQITSSPVDSPNTYLVQGWIVEKLIDNPVGSAGFWLCFNYYLDASTNKDNCSWVKVSTGGVPSPLNPFLPASSGLPPLQPAPPNNTGSNLPGTLIGPIHYSDDQTAWANIGIQPYSEQPNPDIQLWKCSGGIWSYANVINLFVYDCPLYVPNLSLPTDQAVVCNTGFVSNPPPGTPTTLLQVDLDTEAESVNLYVESPATIVAYDAGARLTTEYAKVAFGNAYSNIQLAVDVTNNRYSLINSLGNVVLIK